MAEEDEDAKAVLARMPKRPRSWVYMIFVKSIKMLVRCVNAVCIDCSCRKD